MKLMARQLSPANRGNKRVVASCPNVKPDIRVAALRPGRKPEDRQGKQMILERCDDSEWTLLNKLSRYLGRLRGIPTFSGGIQMDIFDNLALTFGYVS
jgi:hypothetical protein